MQIQGFPYALDHLYNWRTLANEYTTRVKNLKVQLRDWISERFQRINHVLVLSVPLEKFSTFVQSIAPIDNGHKLIRVGPPSDGSYLLPDDLIGIGVNISPGVGPTFQFENALLNEYGIPSIMLDASVDMPFNLPKELEFIHKFVVPQNGSDAGVSISELVSRATKRYGENIDFMLQMDIDGPEYEILKYVSPQDLLRFRIIVVEFHDLDLWVQNAYFESTCLPIFSKLIEYFDVVHSSANNDSHTFRYKKFFMPTGLELTFHRKDRLISRNGHTQLPSVLDFRYKNNASKETPFNLS
jgi:hypothetical protein